MLSSQRALREHEEHHTGEKKFACSLCNKRFFNKRAMVKHERIHNVGGPLPIGRKPRCGDCTGCQRADDCKECPACLDKRKYGGPGKVNRVCR